MSKPSPHSPHKSYTFDTETAISTWRQFLSRDRALSADDLDELETYQPSINSIKMCIGSSEESKGS